MSGFYHLATPYFPKQILPQMSKSRALPKLGSMIEQEPQWKTDILGEDYQAATLDLGEDPDGQGEVFATLVRYRPGGQDPAKDHPSPPRPALLWVHGMTDYFFQEHVARHFFENGYDFYALDLRKCGRSRTEEQTWHYVSDLKLYFVDLAAALDAIPNPDVALIAHSTGGLITPLWLDHLRREDPSRFHRIKGLILDSPWLGMMGVSPTTVKALQPAINALSKIIPRAPFPGGGLATFGQSIHKSQHGEWDFNLTFKPLGGHRKYVGWLAAILKGFDEIHSGRTKVGVPVLTLCSTKSYLGQPYSNKTNEADVVIDVAQTQRWAKELSLDYTLHRIRGARHDVFLSMAGPRAEAFAACDAWLKRTLPAASAS